jgi:hypothetical protein
MEDADSRALVRTEAPSAPLGSLHVAKGARLLHVPSASDSSLGSAGTMEQAWLRADSYEVTSREGNPGQASVEMFFSGLQANLKARAAETAANVAKVEEASKVSASSVFQFGYHPGSPPRHGPAARSRSGFRLVD